MSQPHTGAERVLTLGKGAEGGGATSLYHGLPAPGHLRTRMCLA